MRRVLLRIGQTVEYASSLWKVGDRFKLDDIVEAGGFSGTFHVIRRVNLFKLCFKFGDAALY